MKAFGFTKDIIPTILPVFASHGNIKADIAESLGLSPEAVVAYKAGDQPNNAFSLNVVNPARLPLLPVLQVLFMQLVTKSAMIRFQESTPLPM